MSDKTLTIRPIVFGDHIWESVVDYADNCSWSAGKNLAKRMRANDLNDWERVFVALNDSNIAGYCTFAKTDCIPNVPYTPYIGYIFVGESYRGNRLSEKLVGAVLKYADESGFDKVFLVSDHVNLYEKYGFVKIDEKPAPWNPDTMEAIFMYSTRNNV